MNKLTFAAVALAASAALAACGGAAASGGDDVASLGSTPTPDATTPSTGSVDPQQAMLDYTQCMRDHGIDMPDPEFGSATGGGVVVRQVTKGSDGDGSALDPESPAFKDADAECQPLLRAAVGSTEIDPAQQAEMREQMLAFAQCMRDHGVDFPDPTFSDDGGISVHVGSDDDGPSGLDPDDPKVEAAMEECSSSTGAPMVVSQRASG